jgi:hypothetical protein
LKYFFSPGSNEFSTITFEQKMGMVRKVILIGYGIYDLSEKFRKDRSKEYDHDDMHSVLRNYISKLIFNDYINPYVNKFYESETDETVAKDLDIFVKEPISQEEFIERVGVKFNVKL